MKLLKLLSIILILFCGACAKPFGSHAPASSAPAATSGISAVVAHGAPEGEDGTPYEAEDGQPAGTQSTQGKINRLYDPSIYVIEASDAWRQEVAEGYWADYECKLYLEKVDANDNRSSDGSYSGFFWLGMNLDAGGYISEMLGDVPVEMDFNAGGEGICDNLVITLQARDIWERESYAIPFADGTTHPPKQDVPVDKAASSPSPNSPISTPRSLASRVKRSSITTASPQMLNSAISSTCNLIHLKRVRSAA